MNTLKINYPAEVLWALGQDPDEFEADARRRLAISLYESGKLSSGLAAQVAGVPRTQFLFLLGEKSVSAFGQSPQDLKSDLDEARRAAE